MLGACKGMRTWSYFSRPDTIPEKLTSVISLISIVSIVFCLYASVYGPVQIGSIKVNHWPWLKYKIISENQETTRSKFAKRKPKEVAEKKVTPMEYANLNVLIRGSMVLNKDRYYYKGHAENMGDKRISVTFALIGTRDRNKYLSVSIEPGKIATYNQFMSKTFKTIWTGEARIISASF